MKQIVETIWSQFSSLKGRYRVLLHDLLMVIFAWLLAYWFRFNLSVVPYLFIERAIDLLPLVMAIHFSAFVFFDVHRALWRFVSMSDFIRLIKSVVVGTILVMIFVFFITRLEMVPRTVLVLHGIFLLILLSSSRVAYRLLKEHRVTPVSLNKVLIIGAGSGGELLLRDLRQMTPPLYEPVCFIDDAPEKLDKEIHGVRVIGSIEELTAIVERFSVERVFIAIPSATAVQMQRIVSHCENADVVFQTLPSLRDVVSGGARKTALRAVEIDDLLGREPVTLDWKQIVGGHSGKVVLVTGGGGSIGSELVRQLAAIAPEKIIVFEQSEYNLYQICMELKKYHPDVVLISQLGDVCDATAVHHLFEQYRPDIIFHAAAYKHVPLLEEQLRETARNNIIGTRNVALEAHKQGDATFVLISTDKAVNPSSVMGSSKRVAEVYCRSLNEVSSSNFITVRFGNVLGSTGSVVPLFRQQIRQGGPVTVTHPEMTRYFMTIEEACQLILLAGTVGSGGQIFVLDMGESINITYLAEQMIRLAGLELNNDIEIVYTGLRPGEKLEEALVHPDKKLVDTEHEKLFLATDFTPRFDDVAPVIDEIEDGCDRYQLKQIESAIKAMLVIE